MGCVYMVLAVDGPPGGYTYFIYSYYCTPLVRKYKVDYLTFLFLNSGMGGI